MRHQALKHYVLLLAFAWSAAALYAAESPYAGQERRMIKALSDQEIDDYLNGRGMGASKAAELNQYPGPKHVLDEATRLELTAEQFLSAKALNQAMTRDAMHLGKQIVQKEAELEALFASRQAAPENLRRVVDDLARLQAQFRLVHLNAHLQMQPILTPRQIAQYDRLRGYDAGKAASSQHKHH